MYSAFATDSTTVGKTLVKVAGFDYPKYFAVIEEPDAIYSFEVCIVRPSQFGGELSEIVQVVCTSDSPAHIMRLVRTNLKGWRMHDDVPMRLLWAADEALDSTEPQRIPSSRIFQTLTDPCAAAEAFADLSRKLNQ